MDADWTLVDDEGDAQEVDVNTEAVSGIREQVRGGSQPVNASTMLNSMLLSRQAQE